MTTLREAAQMALEALDSKHDMSRAEWRVLQYKAFQALRAALAAKEQPPTDNGRYLTGYKAQPEPPCKTGSQCISGKCMQCAELIAERKK